MSSCEVSSSANYMKAWSDTVVRTHHSACAPLRMDDYDSKVVTESMGHFFAHHKLRQSQDIKFAQDFHPVMACLVIQVLVMRLLYFRLMQKAIFRRCNQMNRTVRLISSDFQHVVSHNFTLRVYCTRCNYLAPSRDARVKAKVVMILLWEHIGSHRSLQRLRSSKCSDRSSRSGFTGVRVFVVNLAAPDESATTQSGLLCLQDIALRRGTARTATAGFPTIWMNAAIGERTQQVLTGRQSASPCCSMCQTALVRCANSGR
jgi:hypothetical protein